MSDNIDAIKYPTLRAELENFIDDQIYSGNLENPGLSSFQFEAALDYLVKNHIKNGYEFEKLVKLNDIKKAFEFASKLPVGGMGR